jgi:hypothetical protein
MSRVQEELAAVFSREVRRSPALLAQALREHAARDEAFLFAILRWCNGANIRGPGLAVLASALQDLATAEPRILRVVQGSLTPEDMNAPMLRVFAPVPRARWSEFSGRAIDFTGAAPGPKTLRMLARNPSLLVLILDSNRLGEHEALLTRLGQLLAANNTLRRLRIEHNGIHSLSFLQPVLAHNTTLRGLYLARNPIENLDALLNFGQLQSVDLSDCNLHQLDDVARLLAASPGLQRLKLASNLFVDAMPLVHVLHANATLLRLDLSHCRRVTNWLAVLRVVDYTALTQLNLSGNRLAAQGDARVLV